MPVAHIYLDLNDRSFDLKKHCDLKVLMSYDLFKALADGKIKGKNDKPYHAFSIVLTSRYRTKSAKHKPV